MRIAEKIKRIPARAKRQARTALLLLCAVATFAAPAFGGGYHALMEPEVVSHAGSVEDIDLQLVAASAFGEARKAMNATDNELKDTFVENTASIVSYKWQNMGLIIGPRDSLTGTSWGTFLTPTTVSRSEIVTYNNAQLTDAYNKYKAFGFAFQNMNNSAQKSADTSVSAEEGLDAMSAASIKLGSFGVEFLNKYNPGPVLLSLYDSSYLATYSNNELVKIVLANDVLSNVVRFFGDRVVTVAGWNISMFVMLNCVIAVSSLALWMLFKVLMGNGTIGDGIVKFLTRIVIGAAGIFLIANLMSTLLQWVNDTVYNVGGSADSRYVEDNLNIYDWYLTGFQLPSGVTLQIDASGHFMWTPTVVRAVNEYTYGRLVGTPSDELMRERMETYTENGNVGKASFVTPSMASGEEGSEAWSTDVYYALMKNYAENKESLLDGSDDPESPLYGKGHRYGNGRLPIYMLSRYLWMSSLNMSQSGAAWNVTGNGSSTYYGLNPISALNLVRTDFSGESIAATQKVDPAIAYVGFDICNTFTGDAPTHMNAITRFIACFTLVLAALKGLITIITAGFGGLISGGIKTATGSAYGLGQAIGAVLALLGGILGISLIMSMTLSLLDTVYGIAAGLVGDTEVLDGFLAPIVDSIDKIPIIGGLLSGMISGIAEMIMTLVLSLTFPKMGGIPITVFAQAMADIPGHIGERAQMLEAQLASGRSGGGVMGRGHGGGGQYGRMAQGMVGQAFSRATQQTGQIVGAGMAAAGSLAGAGLSLAGKKMNEKADALEGKPQNPGLGNWDDLTPEQQGKAAEAAAGAENWNDMTQDERQQYLSDAGVFDEGADSGALGDAADAVDDAQEAAAEAMADTVDEATEGMDPAQGDGGAPEDAGTPVPDVGEDQGTNQQDASGMEQDAEGPPMEAGEADSVQPEAHPDAANGADGQQPDTGSQPNVHGADASGSMNQESGSGAERTGQQAGQGSGQEGQRTGQGSQAEGAGYGRDGQAGASGQSGASASSGQGGQAGTSGAPGVNETMNVNEGGTTVSGDSNIDNNVRQDANAEVKNVDAGSTANTENVSELGGGDGEAPVPGDASAPGMGAGPEPLGGAAPGQDGPPAGPAVDGGVPGKEGPMGQAPGRDGHGGAQGSFGGGTGSGHGGEASSSGAPGNHTSVNNQSSAESASQQMNVSANGSNTVNMGGEGGPRSMQERVREAREGSGQAASQSLSQEGKDGQGQDGQYKAPKWLQDSKAKQQTGHGGMNGTAASKYGKQMTLKEQKKARTLHAAGDALQMIGGNRTMGEGIRDALGYAKDAALIYSTPDEFQSSDFMQSLRMKRMERNQRRQNRQDGEKKKK